MNETKRFLEEIKTCGRLHADSDKRAKEFYKEFWEGIYEEEEYGGETIFSFHTISGCMIRLLPEYYKYGKDIRYLTVKDRLEFIRKSSGEKCDISELFEKFFKLYHTLANFMPLPKGTLNNSKNTLYKEFPDLFLAGVREFAFTDKKDAPEYGPEVYYMENNKKYFKKFGSWKNYVEKNYLQDFFDEKDEEYSKPIQLSPLTWRFPFTSTIAKSLTDEEREYCKDQIRNFLEKATEIIENRADKLEKIAEAKNNGNV